MNLAMNVTVCGLSVASYALGGCSSGDPASPGQPEPIVEIVSPPREGEFAPIGDAPLWVTFSANESELDTLLWDFGDGVLDTTVRDAAGRINPTYNVYVTPGTYDVTLTGIRNGVSHVTTATGLVRVSDGGWRQPTFNLNIDESPVIRDGATIFEYTVTFSIEQLPPDGIERQLWLTASFDQSAVTFIGYDINQLSTYECEFGSASSDQRYDTTVFSYNGPYAQQVGQQPRDLVTLSLDIGSSFTNELWITPNHYRQVAPNSLEWSEQYPWDCVGELVAMHFVSRDRSRSLKSSFNWLRVNQRFARLKVDGETVVPWFDW
jgi:PKD repeat protein